MGPGQQFIAQGNGRRLSNVQMAATYSSLCVGDSSAPPTKAFQGYSSLFSPSRETTKTERLYTRVFFPQFQQGRLKYAADRLTAALGR